MTQKAQAPEVVQQLTERLGVLGSLHLLLDEVVVPTFQVGELTTRGGIPAMGRVSAAAGGVGTTVKAVLISNVAAQRDVLVESIFISNFGATAESFFVVVDAGPFVGLSTGTTAWRDARENGVPTTFVGQITDASATGRVVQRLVVPANSMLRIPFDYQLRTVVDDPRSPLVIRAADNQKLSVTFRWIEYPRGR